LGRISRDCLVYLGSHFIRLPPDRPRPFLTHRFAPVRVAMADRIEPNAVVQAYLDKWLIDKMQKTPDSFDINDPAACRRSVHYNFVVILRDCDQSELGEQFLVLSKPEIS